MKGDKFFTTAYLASSSSGSTHPITFPPGIHRSSSLADPRARRGVLSSTACLVKEETHTTGILTPFAKTTRGQDVLGRVVILGNV